MQLWLSSAEPPGEHLQQPDNNNQPRDCKIFFMLNTAEHKNFNAHKCKIIR